MFSIHFSHKLEYIIKLFLRNLLGQMCYAFIHVVKKQSNVSDNGSLC